MSAPRFKDNNPNCARIAGSMADPEPTLGLVTVRSIGPFSYRSIFTIAKRFPKELNKYCLTPIATELFTYYGANGGEYVESYPAVDVG